MSDNVEARLRAIEQQVKRQGEMLKWLIHEFLAAGSGSEPSPPKPKAKPMASLSRPSEASELEQIRQNIAFINSEGGGIL